MKRLGSAWFHSLLLLGTYVVLSSFGRAEDVVWNPAERPLREADTLFLPDLSSPATIQRDGGFLWGQHDESLDEVRPSFEFGRGKFGPAVRVKDVQAKYHWVAYPLDGLIPGDAFAVEFWARSHISWEEQPGAAFLTLNSQENRIELRHQQNLLQLRLRWPDGQAKWESRFEELRLAKGRWHHFGITYLKPTLRLYIDGQEQAVVGDVPFHPLWSEGVSASGILLGGAPWQSSTVWISDFRISRTARVPGKAVSLEPLTSRLEVRVDQPQEQLPPPYLGSLHPGQKAWPPSEHPGATPEQTRAALHVVRTDKFLQATPMKRGKPDEAHPSAGVSGRFSYDWQVVDRTFDWFTRHGVAPYISIDAAPSLLGGSVEPFAGEKLRTALSRSSGFGPEVPNNLDDWAAIVRDFVHHVVNERKHEVPWWGVWNEPDQPGFWKGDVKQYLQLYEATVRAVKQVDPDARVGGPESGLDGPWIEALIHHCAKNDLPLDFVSYHDYSGDLNTPWLARQKVNRLTEAAGWKEQLPIVIGEFNWSGGNVYKPGWPRFHRALWHLRTFGAAYTTAYLIRLVELNEYDLMVYSHTHYGDPRAGGWAATQLIGPQRQQWAPYHVLEGWKTVVGDRRLETAGELAPGVFAFASRHSNSGAIGIVLANYGFAQRQERRLQIAFSGLPQGHWKLRRYLVDRRHSSPVDAAAKGEPLPAPKDALDAVFDSDDGKPVGKLAMVEDRTLNHGAENHGAENHGAGAPLRIELDLPYWSSTFLLLTPTVEE